MYKKKQILKSFQYKTLPFLAAIDIGTNSCRLTVASTKSTSLKTVFPWRVVKSYSKKIRLGEGINAAGMFSNDAIERAINALDSCKKCVEDYAPNYKMRIVATHACREALNKGDLLKRAKTELNFDIEVINHYEEALLAFKGCSFILDENIPYACIIDIGGGSTEIILAKKKFSPTPHHAFEFIDSISIPFGIITASKIILNNHDEKSINRFLQEITEYINPFFKKHCINALVDNELIQLISTPGAINTLNILKWTTRHWNTAKGFSLDTRFFIETFEGFFLRNANDFKKHTPTTPKELQKHYAITGGLILTILCKTLSIKSLRISNCGVRDGVLMELFQSHFKMISSYH